MGLFKDKVAIVTGGASGIGRAVCEELGRRDGSVVVADINAEGAGEVASSIIANGGTARAAYLDVSRGEDVRKLVAETVSEHGRLDYMFNNAGIAIIGEACDMTLEHWQRTVDVNLWGVIYGTTAAYSVMVRQGFGHIVNTSSLAGLIPSPILVPYTATKHGVVGLSLALRGEGAGLGVKVSVVCPGIVRTGMQDTATVLKVKREDVLEWMPIKGMPAAKAARRILRDVARNRAVIIVPWHARLPWWLDRIRPGIVTPLTRHGLKYFRRLRDRPPR